MKKILLTMCIALCLPVMCMAKERLVLIGDASLAPHKPSLTWRLHCLPMLHSGAQSSILSSTNTSISFQVLVTVEIEYSVQNKNLITTIKH